MVLKQIGVVLLAAVLATAGEAAVAWAGDSRTLVLEVPASMDPGTGSRVYDDRRVVEKKSEVMEVAADGTWMLIGESTFVIGSWFHDGTRTKTKLLDASGNAAKLSHFKRRDRVYVKGVARKDGTLFAYVIQKR
ncbi:hypothetical protein [Desulfoluna spongiiphila]|uniref:DUF5666 domain-containing protein n=1 Tax=Desulfoluna spongiiphila TaxID=419481 RepID=A0A1G5J0Y8_9BACT|nr:hypothetical protein [Desulfoluna spongiiphila]SCY81611.1 hypothetical protein SAMN05216233_12351 [Desulfoluna spongiiphila]VVS91779.1 hypothetical protein DBB_13470 [Desulfoluna spongiiphila]